MANHNLQHEDDTFSVQSEKGRGVIDILRLRFLAQIANEGIKGIALRSSWRCVRGSHLTFLKQLLTSTFHRFTKIHMRITNI